MSKPVAVTIHYPRLCELGNSESTMSLNQFRSWMAQNICLWYDGTVKPKLGHRANCKWKYDGQVFYHA